MRRVVFTESEERRVARRDAGGPQFNHHHPLADQLMRAINIFCGVGSADAAGYEEGST